MIMTMSNDNTCTTLAVAAGPSGSQTALSYECGGLWPHYTPMEELLSPDGPGKRIHFSFFNFKRWKI